MGLRCGRSGGGCGGGGRSGGCGAGIAKLRAGSVRRTRAGGIVMRPVLHGDLVAAARVLLPLEEAARPRAVWRMLEAAEVADRYRKRTGRPHPRYGGGSLMAAASAWARVPEPWPDDPDYLRCLRVVIVALLERRERAVPCAGEAG